MTKVSAYLDQLAKELEGLDPAKRDDFLREVEAHVQDALAHMDPALPEE